MYDSRFVFMEFLGQESDRDERSHWSEPEHEEELLDENKNWNILVLEQWRKNAVNCIVLISRKSTPARIDPLKW